MLSVQQTVKTRRKIDISQSYYDNIYITPVRAMKEYLLESRLVWNINSILIFFIIMYNLEIFL